MTTRSRSTIHDAGEKVVAVLRQRGRSKATGMLIVDTFAQIWTLRDGKITRMEAYHDPIQALDGAGALRRPS